MSSHNTKWSFCRWDLPFGKKNKQGIDAVNIFKFDFIQQKSMTENIKLLKEKAQLDAGRNFIFR